MENNKNIGENTVKENNKSEGNKHKKLLYIIIPVAVILVVAAVVTAVLVTSKDKPKPVRVTDENGVEITNPDGTPVTVIPETEIVTVFDKDGNPVLDKDGNPVTTVKYRDMVITVPVTDENGNTSYETKVVRPEESRAPGEVIGSTAIVVTDGKGNTGVDESGNVITTIIDITVGPTADIEPAKTEWKYTRGGTQVDYVSDVILTSDKSYITANVTNSLDGNFSKFKDSALVTPYTVLAKTDVTGKIVWEKAVGNTNGVFVVTSLAPASDGSFYAAGYGKNVEGTNGYGFYDAFVAKFSSDGERLWIKKFGTSTVDMFNGIAVTSDGGVVAVGSVGTNDRDAKGFGGAELQSRASIAKYSSSGELVFKNFIGGNQDILNDVTIGKDGNIYAVGSFYSGELFTSKGKSDAGIVKFSSDGKYVSVSPVAGSGVESFNAIMASSDGSLFISGRSNSADSSDNSSFFSGDLSARGEYDAYIIKYNTALEVIGSSAFRGQNTERFEDLVEMPDGTIVAVGYTNSSTRDLKGVTTRGGDDIVIAGFNKRCELLWARSFGGTKDDAASAVCLGADGGYVIAGRSVSKDVDLQNISEYGGGNSVGVVVKFPN